MESNSHQSLSVTSFGAHSVFCTENSFKYFYTISLEHTNILMNTFNQKQLIYLLVWETPSHLHYHLHLGKHSHSTAPWGHKLVLQRVSLCRVHISQRFSTSISPSLVTQPLFLQCCSQEMNGITHLPFGVSGSKSPFSQPHFTTCGIKDMATKRFIVLHL